MILTGWKAIAHYLDSGLRTVQRWEQNGLPVHRPNPGSRSHVVARSEEIDLWVVHSQGREVQRNSDLLRNFARARHLTDELQRVRKEFRNASLL